VAFSPKNQLYGFLTKKPTLWVPPLLFFLFSAFGVSALGLAAAGGHIHVINFLLSLNLNIKSDEKDLTPTPLMAAAARSHVHAASMLELRGADVNYVSPGLGLTAMHLALISGSVDMVDELIQRGSRLEDVQLSAKTPYQIAQFANNTDVVLYLNQLNGKSKPTLYQKTQIGLFLRFLAINRFSRHYKQRRPSGVVEVVGKRSRGEEI
jgi:ankyrin repeat protein